MPPWLSLRHDVATIGQRGVWPDGHFRVVRFSGEALKREIEKKVIEGVSVHIYGVAKTVADTFKFRHKIGTDVAIEALRDAWVRKRCTMDDLARAAKICRVGRVMQPYLEMLG